MNFMVVAARGGFYAAPIGSAVGRETRASKRERAALVRFHGLQADGSHPGLPESSARALARRLEASRRRR